MDNDGDKDVIITEWLGCQGIPNSSRRIFICLNNGNAVFADPIIKVVGPNPAPIGTGDFNGDGKMDIVTQGEEVFRMLELVKSIPDKLYSGAIVTYPENDLGSASRQMQMIVASIYELHRLLKIEKKF